MTSESAYGLSEAVAPADFAAARALFEEYAAQLSVDLCFQDFAGELAALAAIYGPPSGCLFLARHDGVPVACGALRRLSAEVCEMKRLYVRPEARGERLGRLIAERLIAKARALGYAKMVLDSLAEMVPAQTLYRSLGFCEIAPYNRNAPPDMVCMGFDLSCEAPSR
jgi:putative acetyltransferase